MIVKNFVRPFVIVFVSNIVWTLHWSCNLRGKALVSKEDLVKYVSNKDNGVSYEQEANGVKVRITYQPYQLLVLQELEGGSDHIDSSVIRRLEDKYRNQYYFKLKFSRHGKEAIRQMGDFNQYSNMVQVLSFRMGQFVNLTTSQRDTLDLTDYIFDQTYGMSDGNTVLLSFNNSKIKNSDLFDVNVQECGFGTGAVKFRFKKKDIEKVPLIKYTPESK